MAIYGDPRYSMTPFTAAVRAKMKLHHFLVLNPQQLERGNAPIEDEHWHNYCSSVLCELSINAIDGSEAFARAKAIVSDPTRPIKPLQSIRGNNVET